MKKAVQKKWNDAKVATAATVRDMQSRERWAMQFTPRRILVFTVNLVWTIVLWVGVFGKIAFEDLGVYVSYFTNWSWTYQAIFYLLYLLSYLESPRTRTLEFWLLYAFWWNVFCQAMNVFFLVIWVIQDSADIVTKEMKLGGGEYDDGTVLNVEKLYHTFPALMAAFNIFGLWSDVTDMTIYAFADIVFFGYEDRCKHDQFRYRVRAEPAWTYIGFSTILGAVPLLVYYNVFDIQEVYDLEDFPIAAGVFATLAIAFVAVFLPLLYMFHWTIPSRDVPDYQRHAKQPVEPGRYQLSRVPLPS